MKFSRWIAAGVLAGVSCVGTAWAEGPPCPCGATPAPGCTAPGQPYLPTAPGQPSTQPQPSAPGEPATPGQPSEPAAAAPNETTDFSSLGRRAGGTSQGNFAMAGAGGTAGVAGGSGSASTDALTAPSNIIVNLTQSGRGTAPLILPGLFTATEAEGVLPVDRVYLNYGYFDHFRVGTAGPGAVTAPVYSIDPRSTANPNFNVNVILQTPNGQKVASRTLPASLPGSPTTTATVTVPYPQTVFNAQGVQAASGFNLNRYQAGVEKTFLDGQASFYLNVPDLEATDNTTGQAIDGLGDISAGLKFVLLGDRECGNAITGGLTVSAPSARDTVIVTRVTQTARINFLPGPQTLQTATFDPNNPATITTQVDTTRINPTYLQPWLGAITVQDRLFIQDYSGVIVPTDMRIPVYLNEDVVAGYEIYRGPGDAWLSSATPIVGAQALIPVSGASFQFPDQVFLSAGLEVGVGQQVRLSGTYVTPVVGPKAFDGGFTVGVNFLF